MSFVEEVTLGFLLQTAFESLGTKKKHVLISSNNKELDYY